MACLIYITTLQNTQTSFVTMKRVIGNERLSVAQA